MILFPLLSKTPLGIVLQIPLDFCFSSHPLSLLKFIKRVHHPKSSKICARRDLVFDIKLIIIELKLMHIDS